MDKAQLKGALLSVVNRYLHGTPLCDCEDWQMVYNLAKVHSLVGIFYLAGKDTDLPKDVLEKAKADFEVEVMQQALQDYHAENLFKKFRAAGIPFLPLKGYYTRRLYPNPEARSSCDLDVFYDVAKRAEVKKIFEEEGFSFAIENATHEEWVNGKVIVEMHYALVGQEPKFDKYYQDVWARLQVKEGTEYVFSKEDEYVYFLVHAAKHFCGGGIGVKAVIDNYLYHKKVSFDKACLQEQLRTFGLEKFAACLDELSDAWFGGKEEREEIAFLGDFVLSSSAYGTRRNLALSADASSVGAAKRSRLFSAIFPCYRNMKSWYPVLKKAPFLLPFVWVYRWFEVLFTRRKSFAKIAKDMKGIDESGIRAMQKIKEMTGLA